MPFTTNIIKFLSIATIAWSFVYLAPSKLLSQVQQQGYTDVNPGFSQPPFAQVRSSDPGIMRAPVRTAGVQVQEAAPVAPASWSAPIATTTSSSQSFRPASEKSTQPSSVPFAPPSSTSGKDSVSKPTSSWSSTISMMMSLLLVLSLFMGVAWFFRRIAPQPTRTLSKDIVQVLGRTPLAARHNMILIRFGRKLVLVSQQLGQTQTLSEIDDPREVDHLLGLCEAANSTSITTSFRDTLFQLASGKPHDRSSDRSSASAKDLSIARER